MSTQSHAAQRAVVLKLSLATIAEHPRRADLEAAMPAELRQTIESARPSEWLPISCMMQMLEVTWAVLGREEFIAFYVRQSERSRTDSTIGRLLSGVATLFNRAPMARLRHLQRGFDLVQRDIGELSVIEEGENAATYVVDGLPPLLRNVCYATSMIAALEFAVGHDTHAVDCELNTTELARGRIEYRLSWRERAVGW